MTKQFSSSKRSFLKRAGLVTAGIAALSSLPLLQSRKRLKETPPIYHFGAPANLGHIIRHASELKVENIETTDIVIVGSGISALSAASKLMQSGIKHFKILELESFLAGNAACSDFGKFTCGWGSHYVPILSDHSDFLFPFFEQENIITGFNAKGFPIYNELYLCHELKERLFINGYWQESLVPKEGVPYNELKEIERFETLMQAYKYKKGNDGRFGFTIPVALSSQDPKFLALEQITMLEFLEKMNFKSPYLHWYVNYCCRDDYGAGTDTVSAWAGIHYFASRRQKAANADEDDILTWPQGNGFLAQQLSKPFLDKIYNQAVVYQIEESNRHLQINYYHPQHQRCYGIQCEKVILAVPEYVLYYLLNKTKHEIAYSKHMTNYSPWIVANIIVDVASLNGNLELAWDNVSYYCESLGYVNTLHQALDTNQNQTMITFYCPLDKKSPNLVRQEMLNRSLDQWRTFILNDLNKMHPDIARSVRRIDLRQYGHGMCRPVPGFIWQHAQKRARQLGNRIFIAHSDMSGISLFEEAYWQGLQTAGQLIQSA